MSSSSLIWWLATKMYKQCLFSQNVQSPRGELKKKKKKTEETVLRQVQDIHLNV